MLKRDMQILIVEDDKFFGKACAEAIQRSGYQAVLMANPEEALKLAKVQQFQAMVIDCMLPKIPGVDLAAQLKTTQHSDFPMILMSGIYKDRNFIRQATQSTGASLFLTKPFNVSQLIEAIDSSLADITESAKNPLPQLFMSDQLRRRKILEAIDLSENVHGFELPYIFSLFLNAGISGQMNVVEAQGNLFGISFKSGKIVSVETNDPPIRLGEMLTESGYLSDKELNVALDNQGNQPLGKYLIDSNLISPHAIEETMVHQMDIWLGNTVKDTSVEVNFMESDAIKDANGISIQNYVPMLHRWIQNKINETWLENYYLPWLDHQMKVNMKLAENHPVFKTPFFVKNTQFLQDFEQHVTIQKLLDVGKYKPSDVYFGVHLLSTTRCTGFGTAVQVTDYDQLLKRLKKMSREFKDKNHFEVLNVSQNAKSAEIRRSFHELTKVVHPDKLGSDAPEELLQLNKELYEKINKAHDILQDEKSRQLYLKELEETRARQLLQADSTVERAKQLLKTGKYKESLDLFNEVYALQKDNFELNAYRIWARIKSIDPANETEELLRIEHELTELAQYDRRTEIFQYIKGLYQFQKGNIERAKHHFDSAVSINPNFLEARRELNVIKLKHGNNKPVDLLRGDLKDVVGLLFKKK